MAVITEERIDEIMAGNLVTRGEIRDAVLELRALRRQVAAFPPPIQRCPCGTCAQLRRRQNTTREATDR